MKVYAVYHGWYDLDGSFAVGVDSVFTLEADAQEWAAKLQAHHDAAQEAKTVITVREHELLEAVPPEPPSWAAERQAQEAEAQEEAYPDSGLPRNWN